jgi:hypothetical protein
MALSQAEPELLAAMFGGKALLSKLKRKPQVTPPNIESNIESEPDISAPDVSPKNDIDVNLENLQTAVEDSGKSIVSSLSKLEDEISTDLFSVNFNLDVIGELLEEILVIDKKIFNKLPNRPTGTTQLETSRESKREKKASKIKRLTKSDGTRGPGDEGGGLMGMISGFIPMLIPVLIPVLAIVGKVVLAVVAIGASLAILTGIVVAIRDWLMGAPSVNPGESPLGKTASSTNPDGTARTQREIDEAQLENNQQARAQAGSMSIREVIAEAKQTKDILDAGGTMKDVITARIADMKSRSGDRSTYNPNAPVVPASTPPNNPRVLFPTTDSSTPNPQGTLTPNPQGTLTTNPQGTLTPENVKPSDLIPTNTPVTPPQTKDAADKLDDIMGTGNNSGYNVGDKVTSTKVSNITNIFNPTEPRSPSWDIVTGFPTGIGFA